MIYEFIEPECNSYVIQVRLDGVRKCEALSLAELIECLAESQLPNAGLAMTVAHVKYDFA